MEFEWDDNKSEQIFRTRGFDFGFAAQAFLDTKAVHRPDTRSNYGEARFRIITAWKANEREIQDHAGWQLAEGNI